MITIHARPRQADRRTNVMAIARRFVLTNASHAKNRRKIQPWSRIPSNVHKHQAKCEAFLLNHAFNQKLAHKLQYVWQLPLIIICDKRHVMVFILQKLFKPDITQWQAIDAYASISLVQSYL